MALRYRRSGGAEYASYGRSVRCGDRVRTEYTYIGKVIDREKGLFFNRKLGYIVFDDDRRRILPAPCEILPETAKEEELATLGFGDAFFLCSYMRTCGISEIIDSMDIDNRDTLYTLIVRYALTLQGLDRMRGWYEGNCISQLCPDAKVDIDDAIDFLEILGNEKYLKLLSDAYFKLMTGKSMDDYGTDRDDPDLLISVDGQNIAPDMEMPMTSRYSGMSCKDRHLRLVIVFRNDTHVPLYFRYVPEKLLRSSGISVINHRMMTLGVGVNFSLMDNDYCTRSTVCSMCKNNVPFVTMLPEDNEFYTAVMAGVTADSMRECASYEKSDGIYYVSEKVSPVMEDVTCMLYTVMMRDPSVPDGNSRFRIIVSSRKMDPEEAASICYVRNIAENYFRVTRERVNGSGNHRRLNATAIRGHMIVSFIASSLITRIKNELENRGLDPRESYRLIRDQRCRVFSSRMIPEPLPEKAEAVYSALGMTCPAVIPRPHGRK